MLGIYYDLHLGSGIPDPIDVCVKMMPVKCVFQSLSLYWTNRNRAKLQDAALSWCPVSTVNYMLLLPLYTPCSHSPTTEWMKETGDSRFSPLNITMKPVNSCVTCTSEWIMIWSTESFYVRPVFSASTGKKTSNSAQRYLTETVFSECQQNSTDFRS